MVQGLLFKKVKCKGYLSKNKNYINVQANMEDERVEDKTDKTILLEYGGTYIQDIYELKEKEFSGIVVATFLINTRRHFEENYNGFQDKSEIIIEAIGPTIRVAKVYFGNNKSRLVPITKLQSIED